MNTIENIFEAKEKNEGGRKVFNFKEVLSQYLHYWWLFLLLVIISLGLSWLYLRYTIPVYEVSSTLLVRNENSRGGGGAQAQDAVFSGLLMQSGNNKQNEIQILNSRSLMMRVVNKLGLVNQYYVQGNVKTTNIFNESPFTIEILDKGSMKGETITFNILLEGNNRYVVKNNKNVHKNVVAGETFEFSSGKFAIHTNTSSFYNSSEYKEFIFRHTPDYITALNLLKSLKVVPLNDQSNVLELTFTTDNPVMGAAILNMLMGEYNQAAIEDKNETNRLVLGFLDDRLKLVEKQLDSVETDLQRYKTSRNVIDLSGQSQHYFDNLGQLGGAIRDQEVQLNVLQLLEQYVRSKENADKIVPSTLGVADPLVATLIADYNKLIAERQTQLQTGATEANPVIRNMNDNIADARQKIINALTNVRKAYNASLSTLERKNNILNNQINSIPEKEKQSRDRIRQQEIKQNLYLYLLEKREEASIAAASTISSARVIDKAIELKNQVSPQKIKIYAIALLAGLMIPIIIIYLIGLLNDRVTTKEDITKVTNAPILGEIGHNPDEKVLLFKNNSRSVVAEQVRILRTNLRFMLGDRAEKPVIMITSSFSGEGKSFISTNLAGSLALSGKKTVILEFDLRKPKILHGLGIERNVGLSNYLIGAVDVSDLPFKVNEQENLYVIGCGPVPPNPAELILGERVKLLFDWLKEEFDAVIIDTAPVGLVSDSIALSAFADMVLYVVRQRHTYKRQIEFVDEVYRLNKLPNMGLVVNDVITRGARGYYGYGGGSYGYGYGYGYGSKAQTGYFGEENTKSKHSFLNRILLFLRRGK